MNQITFKQYRNIDLTILAVLLVISEAVTTVATNSWFVGVPIAISTTLLFVCIGMMRWGICGAVYPILGGLVFCIASGATAQQYLIYALGNALSLVSLVLFKIFTKEKIRLKPSLLILFVSCTYLFMQLGRWLTSLIFVIDFSALLMYVLTDTISLVFAVVIMLLLRNTDGMIEDQKAYLFRKQREEKEKERARAMSPNPEGEDL